MLMCCTHNFLIVLIFYQRPCCSVGLVTEEVSAKIHDAFYVNRASAELCSQPEWPWFEAIPTSDRFQTLPLKTITHNNQPETIDISSRTITASRPPGSGWRAESSRAADCTRAISPTTSTINQRWALKETCDKRHMMICTKQILTNSKHNKLIVLWIKIIVHVITNFVCVTKLFYCL